MKQKQPLYIQISNQMIDEIDQAIYNLHDKLPSLRSLARQYDISLMTANEVYQRLIDLGYIYSKPKSGYFVSKQASSFSTCQSKAIDPIPCKFTKTKEVFDLIKTPHTESAISFGTAYPDHNSDIKKQVNYHLKKQITQLQNQPYFILPAEGDLSLRKEVSKWAAQRNFHLDYQNMMITNGCQEAILIALKSLTKPGDTILVESPCYSGHLLIAEELGLNIIEIARDYTAGIDLDLFETILKTYRVNTAILMANHHNPIGNCLADDQKKKIIKIAKKYDLQIIEDDVFGDLAYQAQYPLPLKAFDEDVLYCSSFSKTIDASLRIGWLTTGKYFDACLEQKYILNQGSPTLPQKALAAFLNSGKYNRSLNKMKETYRQRQTTFLQLIHDHFPENISVNTAKGGYLSWMQLPKNIDIDKLHHEALAHNIRIAAGNIFSSQDLYSHFIRINFAEEWTSARKKAFIKLGELIKSAETR